MIEDICSCALFFHDFVVRQCRFSRRIISFNPDHVSSTAQTFRLKPSGNATAQ